MDDFSGCIEYSMLVIEVCGRRVAWLGRPGKWALFQPTGLQTLTNRVTASAQRGTIADVSATWMFWHGSTHELTPAQFSIALGLRVGVLPEKIILPATCNCGSVVTNVDTFTEHAYKCDVFTGFTHTHRHNAVVRDALVPVARSFGIDSTIEPTQYSAFYEVDKDGHGSKRRPDVTFRTTPPLAIDATIVYPTPEPGIAAAEAARRKIDKHRYAVEKLGHAFEPFAMEITGFLHESSLRVIEILARELLPLQRTAFRSELLHAIGVALARGRTAAIQSAIAKQNQIVFKMS